MRKVRNLRGTLINVDGNKKCGGVGKEAINQLLSGIVTIGGYFKFERDVSL